MVSLFFYESQAEEKILDLKSSPPLTTDILNWPGGYFFGTLNFADMERWNVAKTKG